MRYSTCKKKLLIFSFYRSLKPSRDLDPDIFILISTLNGKTGTASSIIAKLESGILEQNE